MEPWAVQTLASIIGGGLAGWALTIFYNWLTAKQKSNVQEKATMAALAGELKYIRRLCDFNAQGAWDIAFANFPTTVALKVAFEDRHLYPRLQSIHQDLEALVLAIIQVNQLIDLYRTWLLTPYVLNRQSSHAQMEPTRNKICGLCTGQLKVENVGPENFIILPTFADVVLKKLEKISI